MIPTPADPPAPREWNEQNEPMGNHRVECVAADSPASQPRSDVPASIRPLPTPDQMTRAGAAAVLKLKAETYGRLLVESDPDYAAKLLIYRACEMGAEALAVPQLPPTIADIAEGLASFLEHSGPLHEDDCPGDDTCSCAYWRENSMANAAARLLDRLAR